MAPPDSAAVEAIRDFATELGASETRLTEAERYLGLDRLVARQAELEAEAGDPSLWDDAERGRVVTTEPSTADLSVDERVELSRRLLAHVEELEKTWPNLRPQ